MTYFNNLKEVFIHFYKIVLEHIHNYITRPTNIEFVFKSYICNKI